MKPRSRRERIGAQLVDLQMPGALEALDEVLSGVDGGRITGAEGVERLLGAQIALRNARRLATAMRSSRLTTVRRSLADPSERGRGPLPLLRPGRREIDRSPEASAGRYAAPHR